MWRKWSFTLSKWMTSVPKCAGKRGLTWLLSLIREHHTNFCSTLTKHRLPDLHTSQVSRAMREWVFCLLQSMEDGFVTYELDLQISSWEFLSLLELFTRSYFGTMTDKMFDIKLIPEFDVTKQPVTEWMENAKLVSYLCRIKIEWVPPWWLTSRIFTISRSVHSKNWIKWVQMIIFRPTSTLCSRVAPK